MLTSTKGNDMATKRQVVKAIAQKWEGATLNVTKINSSICAEIKAPDGYYFDEGSHTLGLAYWYNSDGMMFEYWDEALDYVNTEDSALVSCNDDDYPCCHVIGHSDCEDCNINQAAFYEGR